MMEINNIRSSIATRAFRLALRRKVGFGWLVLIGALMPKSVAERTEIRIPRRALQAIVREADPQRVAAVLSRLEARTASSAWVTAFALDYGLARGDWSFTKRFLHRYLKRLVIAGAQVPKRYLTLLVASQIAEHQATEALQTLSQYGPSCSDIAFARESKLLAASALIGDEVQWLARVNEFLEKLGLGTIALAGSSSGTRFSRLIAKGNGVVSGDNEAKVTVVVSCFNAANFLEKSLNSLFQQSYRNLEIIAVDDMSSDRTWELLQSLAKSDPRLRLLRNPKNVGTYVSRNRALRASTGDYVTTQDSDDWSHPDRIRHQLTLLEDHAEAIASYCAGLRMWSDGRFEVHQRTGDVIRRLCYASLMYRKKAIIDLTGYWDCVRVEADAEYLRRVLRLCGPSSVLACAAPLMIQLRREDSLTTLAETRNIQRLIDGPRMTYRAEAAHFAKTLQAGNARYDFEAWQRPFPAPASIVIPDELVREAASWE